MLRRWIKSQLPDPVELQQRLGVADAATCPGHLQWLRTALREPELWHLSRRSVSGAVATGLFVSFLPVPLQMLIAASLAAILRVHVPVSMAMVWFTNPLTIPPLLYAAYRTGSILLGRVHSPSEAASLSVHRLLSGASQAWAPILTGCLFLGVVSAVIGYTVTSEVWRANALRRWRQRKHR